MDFFGLATYYAFVGWVIGDGIGAIAGAFIACLICSFE